MGFFSTLTDGNKEDHAEVNREVAAISAATVYAMETPGIRPEIVAAIIAAVSETMGTKKLAVRIRQTSNMWAVTGRQKLMDARQN